MAVEVASLISVPKMWLEAPISPMNIVLLACYVLGKPIVTFTLWERLKSPIFFFGSLPLLSTGGLVPRFLVCAPQLTRVHENAKLFWSADSPTNQKTKNKRQHIT